MTSKGVHMPSVRASINTADRDAAVHLSLSQPVPIQRGPVSLYDCFEALQVDSELLYSRHSLLRCQILQYAAYDNPFSISLLQFVRFNNIGYIELSYSDGFIQSQKYRNNES